MSIYRNYRKIYKTFHGLIPKDQDGRTYDIHHIDGNRKNNNIFNLIALSIQDHFDVHYIQGDWGACARIAQRMSLDAEIKSSLLSKSSKKTAKEKKLYFQKISKDELSRLSTETNERRVKNGTHNFLNKNIESRQRELQKLETGEHIFLNEDFRKDILLPAIQKSNTKRVLEGTHNFFDPSIRQKALESTLKKQRELLSMGKHQSQFEWICPNCKKSGKGKGAFSRFHGDNCKFRYEPLEL